MRSTDIQGIVCAALRVFLCLRIAHYAISGLVSVPTLYIVESVASCCKRESTKNWGKNKLIPTGGASLFF